MKNSLLVLALGLLLVGCETATDPALDAGVEFTSAEAAKAGPIGAEGPGALSVMTRNVYIGTDVSIVLGAESPEQVPVLAAQAFQTLLATNFPERAKALAEEIAETQPHVIGLQEATTIRRQSPGDAVAGGTAPAQDVVFDYLAILMKEISDLGLDYRVAGVVENVDIELPMLAGTNPIAFDDIRVTDFDVILARHDVEISNVVDRNFQVGLPLPSLGTSLPRGFVAVDATIFGRTYRVANTHLEPFSIQVQMAQAQELVGALADETKPVVLLGDFNTPAPSGTTYNFLQSEGYLDVWSYRVGPKKDDGDTCCQAADLRNPTSLLDERIDLIFFKSNNGRHGRGGLAAVFADVVGEEQDDRTPSGLWPSDHAGVIATMRIPAAAAHSAGASRP